MTLVLGAALGPHATGVEVRDADTGALVASGSARHQDLGPDVDDPTAWWRSLTHAIGQTGEREIAALSVCGGHPGLVLLDGAGAVLRPVQPWADDETTPDAKRLRAALGADRWARRAGAIPGPATAVARLAWLRRTDPGTFARLGAALLPHDWLTYRLVGRPVTDRGSASLTGAWSPAGEGWLAEVLEQVAPDGTAAWWRDRLPEVLGPAARADWLDAPVYELLGLRGRPLVGPGTAEAMAVALALGVRPGRVAVSLAHATTVLAGLDEPLIDPTGTVRSRADATGRHLAMSGTPGGAALLEAVRSLFGLSADELAAQAGASAGTSAGAAGELLLVPGVAGRLGAVLTGLTTDVTRGAVARAAIDGVACAALDTLDLVVDAGVRWDDDDPLLLTAPAADLAAQARALADLSGRAVQTGPAGSLAAAGACIQAAAVLHDTDPAEVAESWALVDGPWIEPDEDVDEARHERRTAFTQEWKRQRAAVEPAG